jgi:hypothetical protein
MPDAIIRLMPDPVLRLWTATMEVARRREVRRLVLALALLIAAAAYIRFMADIFRGDAYGYWESIRRNVLYVTALDTAPHGYLYSPAFIQALWPLFSLPWEIFYGIWLALLTVALLWIARPWLSLVIFAPIFLTFGISLLLVPRHSLASGNIYLFMGLAVVAGFRWPSTYAFLLLTKVTPGVGLLWFVVRREWRNLAIALGTTAAIVAVSFAFSSNLWFDWFTVLKQNSGYGEPAFAIHFLPLIPRLAIAVVLTIVAAHYNARWVLPIATLLALPYIADTGLIMLVCVAPLLRHDAWTESPARKTAAEPGALAPAPTA